MRLVNVDALEPAICDRVCGGNNSCVSPCLEIESLRKAATVEAIPCEYIQKKSEKAIGPEATYLRKLITDWEKDHATD